MYTFVGLGTSLYLPFSFFGDESLLFKAHLTTEVGCRWSLLWDLLFVFHCCILFLFIGTSLQNKNTLKYFPLENLGNKRTPADDPARLPEILLPTPSSLLPSRDHLHCLAFNYSSVLNNLLFTPILKRLPMISWLLHPNDTLWSAFYLNFIRHLTFWATPFLKFSPSFFW